MDTPTHPKILIGKDFAPALAYAINCAKINVKLIVFSWSIKNESTSKELNLILNALKNAQKQNIEILCLCGSEGLTRLLISYGFRAKNLTNFKTVHAKLIIIDDKIIFIGSHNLTKCAMSLNLEISANFKYESDNNEATSFFNRLWNLHG